MKITIGIDPGKSGGIAVINRDENTVSVYPMPDTVIDLVDLLMEIKCRFLATGKIVAYVEFVHSSPQMGVVSAFTFGRGLGNIEAALAALRIPLVWVRPAEWQGALKCRTKGDKNITKKRAQEMYPAVKVTHKLADALLIANYGSFQD